MPEVCLVVPCFNEERRLPVADIADFLRSHPQTHVCLVDDGSVDGTEARLKELEGARPGQILLRRLPGNRGKAEAVRYGVLEMAALRRFAFVGYWDADLSTPLGEVDRMLSVLLAHPYCELVLGSRVKRLGSHIDRRTVRHVCGRLFATAVRAVLGLSIYDSQCGAKIFRSEIAAPLFAEPFLTRWLFDLELLARLQARSGTPLETAIEVPLERWREVKGSKLRWRDFASVPVELLRIRSRYQRSAAGTEAVPRQRPGRDESGV